MTATWPARPATGCRWRRWPTWSGQRYATVTTGDVTTPPGLQTAFTAAERKRVGAAVLARCDALYGATDGLVQDSTRCQARFDQFRDVPTCTGARDGNCLTLAQKLAPGNTGGVNAEVPATWAANRTRPLCAYPAVATYKGSGSLETASSFECRAPRDRRR